MLTSPRHMTRTAVAATVLAGVLALGVALPASASAAVFPNVGVSLVAKGLSVPIAVASPPDNTGRLFVLQQDGRIRVIVGGRLQALPYLNLTPVIHSSYEQGALGLTFAPDFATSGRLFATFSTTHGTTVLARYIVRDPRSDVAAVKSKVTVLSIARPGRNHLIHYGGDLHFGADRMLYMSTGDSGPSADASHTAQNPSLLHGKVLRLNVLGVGASLPGRPAYTIPRDNPFVSPFWKAKGWRPEIWLYGFRNPWRFSFDRATGAMYIADVGQDSWEEIDYAAKGVKGRNYGWSWWEGDHRFRGGTIPRTGFTFPIAEVIHPELLPPGSTDPWIEAIVGGYVYRGTVSPKLAGTYFFADWVSGRIWGMKGSPTGVEEVRPLLYSNHNWTSFGESANGQYLYLTDLKEGSVYRLVQK